MFRFILTAACFLGLITSTFGGVNGHRLSPGPFTIKVEIEGVTQGVFQAIEGLSSSSQVLEANTNGILSEIPGALKGSHLILQRLYEPQFNGLWRWRQSVIEGDMQKRDGHIFIFDARGQSVAHWIFHRGWPCRWEVPSLKSSSEEPALEVVEIVHQGLTLAE